jgi:hypothetical protein
MERVVTARLGKSKLNEPGDLNLISSTVQVQVIELITEMSSRLTWLDLDLPLPSPLIGQSPLTLPN